MKHLADSTNWMNSLNFKTKIGKTQIGINMMTLRSFHNAGAFLHWTGGEECVSNRIFHKHTKLAMLAFLYC